MDFIVTEHPHNRFNPLKGEWVLVSPKRLNRPWDGQVENEIPIDVPEYDPKNPLCPGAVRANGEVNPNYESTFVFTNDFPALYEPVPSPPSSKDPLFRMEKASGTCRVMCFHPKSNMTLPLMSLQDIHKVIQSLIMQMTELQFKYDWVQIFENKGEMMGCSNPHPHCQIWASNFIPNEPRIKDQNQKEYFKKYGQPLLLDYVQNEIEKEERIVLLEQDWVVVVPFWAAWPFETMVLPRFHVKRFVDLNDCQQASLAVVLNLLTIKYDNLFKTSFPYTMGWHGAPTGQYISDMQDHWVVHAVFYPPLLRSATIKKFMVGYEMLAQAQRDLTPEQAAKILREQSNIHYTKDPEYLNSLKNNDKLLDQEITSSDSSKKKSPKNKTPKSSKKKKSK